MRYAWLRECEREREREREREEKLIKYSGISFASFYSVVIHIRRHCSRIVNFLQLEALMHHFSDLMLKISIFGVLQLQILMLLYCMRC